jgi:Tol biopolymer transport system component
MADAASLESVDLQGKRTAILSEAGSPPIVSACWIADGRLLFSRSWQESTRSGNSLWGIPVDGRSGLPASAPEKIAESAGFWWDRLSASADGKRLAFANCRDQGDVYLGELVGGGTRLSSPRRLTLDEREDLLGGWSRDGRWILFASDRSGSLDLFRQAPDSRSAESVFVGPDADGRPIMAPDGSSVLFVQSGDGSPQDLRLLRLPGDGGAPEIVLELDALTVRGVRCSTGSCVLAEKVEPGQLVFFALDPVRGKQGELARVEFRQSARMFRSWDVSPDGSQLALVEYDRPLRLVSLVDKRVREIPLGDWRSPQNVAWSHDGKSLFITGWAGNQMLLLRVDLDGRTTILWRQWPGFIFNLAPSPDGRYLAAGVRVVDSNVWLLEDF